MKRRKRIIIVLLAAVVIAVIVGRWRAPGRGDFAITTTGPLDMRLWGIRPDAGGVVYDQNGKKLQDTFGIARLDRFTWQDRDQRCDFIFEISDSNEPVQFTSGRLTVSGGSRRLRSWIVSGRQMLDYHGRRLLVLKMKPSRTFKKSMPFGLWTMDVPVDRCDLSLGYYQGSPRVSICSFKGPFKPGLKLADETGLYELTLEQDPNADYPKCHRFELNAKEHIIPNPPALFHDTAGGRHTVRALRTSSRQGRNTITYEVSGQRTGFPLSLQTIKMITFGETPFNVTVKNLRFDVPRRDYRSYPDYYDRMAEARNLSSTPKTVPGISFQSVNEMLKVADIVRGTHLLQVAQRIARAAETGGQFDPATFNAEQISALKRTALGWAKAIDPDIRIQAVIMGLKCKWPEFVEPACQLLRYCSSHHEIYKVVRALARNSRQLSNEAIDCITQILPSQRNRYILMDLKSCLTSSKSDARIKALSQLAEDERPWLWWAAIKKLADWRQFESDRDALPEKLKLRLFLVASPAGFSNPEQIAPKAYSLLPDLLTPEMHSLDPLSFSGVLGTLISKLDHKSATAAMINFLRRLDDRDYHDPNPAWSLGKIVKCINLWHEINIGELGTDYNHRLPNPDEYDWRAITTEVIEWYESVHGTGDV